LTPLDLTRQAPRAARAEIDGIVFLARAIDKARASLPGGNLGSYFFFAPRVPTMSGMFYQRLGIAHDDFVAAVTAAENDDDVAAWVRARAGEPAIEKLRSQLLGIRMGLIPPESRAVVNALYPAGAAAGDDMLLVDLIDEDDAAIFASR
jgi:hypothetical protein